MEKRSLNICRPGFGASCALCCGSHNYRASREEIVALFLRRREALGAYSREYLVSRMRASRSDLTGSYYFSRQADPGFVITLPRLYEDGTQCPFVAFIGDSGAIGCHLYPDGRGEDLRLDCFQNYTCKYFSCHARDLLSDAKIEYAARLTGDWYYYTLLVHRIDLLRGLMKDRGTLPALTPALREELEGSLLSDTELHTLSSYFS